MGTNINICDLQHINIFLCSGDRLKLFPNTWSYNLSMFLSLGKLFKVASLMSELAIESKQGYHRRLHFHRVGLEKQKYV